MYQVGDRVRIDPELHYGNDYSWFVPEDMVDFAGEIMTITNACVVGGVEVYRMYEDDGEWGYTPDMITEFIRQDYEEYKTEEIDMLYEMGV